MGGEADDHDQEESPILGSFSSSSSSDFHHHDESYELVKRTGTTWTAVAHIITGVIGAGVLSLSWSVAQLGWIAGPLTMIIFAMITIVSTNLLSDCYRYPDPEFGHARCRSYAEAVRLYLGDKWQYVCGALSHESFYGTGIAYTFTCASSIRKMGGAFRRHLPFRVIAVTIARVAADGSGVSPDEIQASFRPRQPKNPKLGPVIIRC